MKCRSYALSLPLVASLCLAAPACGDPSGVGEFRTAPLQEKALGASQTFLIVYKNAGAVPASAAADILKAGGSWVASFPKIGVGVARASDAAFVTKLAKCSYVQSVVPTTGEGVSALPANLPSAGPELERPRPTPGASEPFAAMQWNMDQIHASEARAITPGKKSVIVGVLDSGIDDTVPDLQGQVDHGRSVTCIGGVANGDPSGWSYDAIGHGTYVAGIIGAKQNEVGVVGVAPGATLAAVKLTEDGFVYPEAFLCGLYWAATHQFNLVNASLIVDPWYYNCSTDPTQRAISTALQRAVSFASRQGVTVIAAASNEQQDLDHKTNDPFSPTDAETVERTVTTDCKLLPLELDGVVGVSAMAADGNLAYYSNYGRRAVDLSAPGGDFHVPATGNESGQILSDIPSYSYYYQAAIDWNGRVAVGCTDGLDPNDPASDPSTCAQTYALLQGTSGAAPHVTGVAALALSKFGRMSTSALLAKLSSGATKLSCPPSPYQPYPDDMPAATCEGSRSFNSFYGKGEVNALSAVTR